ncbi:MAG: hypothetical protein ACRCTJ_06395 [Brevinema sp.]
MFSLPMLLRIYIIFTIIVMGAFFIALTSIDVILEPIWVLLHESSNTENIFKNIYISIIIMSLVAIVYGVLISIFAYDRGIYKYQDLLRRIEAMDTKSYVRPILLRFPNTDEFGDLGEKFNNFLTKVDYYDQLKTALAKIEQEKFAAIAAKVDFGILLINTGGSEPYISFYNDAFKDTFLKKSIFIDGHGKPQTLYYSFENTPLTFFHTKNEEQTPFFDEKQLEKISNTAVLLEKAQQYHNVSFKEIGGEKNYIVEELHFIPLNNSVEKVQQQVLYLFINPKLSETKTLNVSEIKSDSKEKYEGLSF